MLVTGYQVTVSSLGFKCPGCFIWNCSYIVYPSKIKGPFRDNRFLPMIGVADGGMCGRHLLSTSPRSSAQSSTAIEQAPSVDLPNYGL